MDILKKISGCVNWPVNDPRYTDSGEGGLWAGLFVFQGGEDRWGACCIDAQCPLGKYRNYAFPEPCDFNAAFGQIVLGSTNCSLWDDKKGIYFQATYDDLTDEGKTIFDTIRKLYPSEFRVEIVTFLDT